MEHWVETTVTAPDGAPLWYRAQGSGSPALVLCDGVGCAGFIWKYLIPHFAEQHRIIHWNYRGHGKSPIPENLDGLGIEQCAEDLKLVLADASAKEPVVLLGHSMGVQVILEFYHRCPDQVLALVPITGSHGRAIDHIHDKGMAKLMFPLAKLLVTHFHAQVREAWPRVLNSEVAYLYSCLFEVNPRLIKREDFLPYFRDLGQVDPAVFLRTVEGAAKHTAEPYLRDIKVPVLILAGEVDQFTPYWLSQRMHGMIPSSELFLLPQGSHAGPLELPDLTNSRIAEFLAELDGDGPEENPRRRRNHEP